MASQQQDNVAIVREGDEAFNEQNLEAVLERFDEDIEWVEPEAFRYGGTYRGSDAVVENVFEPAFPDIEDLHLDVDRFIDDGETVVVLGCFQGRATETGDTLEVPFAHAIDLGDGHFTRFQDYIDTARMEQALGAEGHASYGSLSPLTNSVCRADHWIKHSDKANF